MKDAGFAIPSLQALLFDRPDLQVFGTPGQQSALIDHLARVAQLAAALTAKVMVFGSPKNRDPGDLSYPQAMHQAVGVFRKIGRACADAGVVLAIEANPRCYHCNFLTRWHEAEELVRRCNHPGIALHLDTACTVLAGDDPAAAIPQLVDILAHVHISEPDLGPFDTPQIDHQAVGRALQTAGYQAWCSVEMRRTAQPLQAIEQAARLAHLHYGERTDCATSFSKPQNV